jgi:hypothetical protein
MRTVPAEQIVEEQATERKVAYCFHFYCDDATGARVYDWCYTDFDSPVTLTGVDSVERTFAPTTIRFDDKERVVEQTSEINTGRKMTMKVERIEPFITFFGSRWPFPIKVNGYKIYRRDLTFYDVLPLDEVGAVERDGATITLGLIGKFRVLTRKLPQPVYGPGCWKRLFSTGPFGCRADKTAVSRGPYTPTIIDQNVIYFKQAGVLAERAGFFDRGRFEYAGTVTVAPGVDVDVNFAPQILVTSVVSREDPDDPGNNVDMLQVELDWPPSVLATTTPVTLVGGCARTMDACQLHAPAGGGVPGWLRIRIWLGGLVRFHLEGANFYAVIEESDEPVGSYTTLELNGVAVTPNWHLVGGKYQTDTFAVSPALPGSGTPSFVASHLSGRSYALNIVQSPDAGNNWHAIVGVWDAPGGGAIHDFELRWAANEASLYGNLNNFGGTPYIPRDNGVLTSTVKCK